MSRWPSAAGSLLQGLSVTGSEHGPFPVWPTPNTAFSTPRCTPSPCEKPCGEVRKEADLLRPKACGPLCAVPAPQPRHQPRRGPRGRIQTTLAAQKTREPADPGERATEGLSAAYRTLRVRPSGPLKPPPTPDFQFHCQESPTRLYFTSPSPPHHHSAPAPPKTSLRSRTRSGTPNMAAKSPSLLYFGPGAPDRGALWSLKFR